MDRRILGLLALLGLLGGSVALLVYPSGTTSHLWAGIAIRVAAVLGAIWLISPELRRLSARRLLVAVGAAAVILIRPRLVFFLAPLALLLMALASRRRGS